MPTAAASAAESARRGRRHTDAARRAATAGGPGASPRSTTRGMTRRPTPPHRRLRRPGGRPDETLGEELPGRPRTRSLVVRPERVDKASYPVRRSRSSPSVAAAMSYAVTGIPAGAPGNPRGGRRRQRRSRAGRAHDTPGDRGARWLRDETLTTPRPPGGPCCHSAARGRGRARCRYSARARLSISAHRGDVVRLGLGVGVVHPRVVGKIRLMPVAWSRSALARTARSASHEMMRNSVRGRRRCTRRTTRPQTRARG